MGLQRQRTRTAGAVLFSMALSVFPASAAGENAPRLSDPEDRVASPDLSGLPRLRFLTTLDFPPFNFADSRGRAAGFNVDLARALCRELEIEQKCEIQAMPWDELDATHTDTEPTGSIRCTNHGIRCRALSGRAVRTHNHLQHRSPSV